MLAAGIPGEGTELVNPDFVGLARSAGMFGVKVEDRVIEAGSNGGVSLLRTGAGRSSG